MGGFCFKTKGMLRRTSTLQRRERQHLTHTDSTSRTQTARADDEWGREGRRDEGRRGRKKGKCRGNNTSMCRIQDRVRN